MLNTVSAAHNRVVCVCQFVSPALPGR
jgi:hypothetical protein